MIWYFHLFKSFPQFIVIHTVKGFGIVSKAEVDVFLKLSCFFDDLVKVKVKSLNRVQLFVTPWTVAHQAPLSIGFSRQEYWNGLPFPSPDDPVDVGNLISGSSAFSKSSLNIWKFTVHVLLKPGLEKFEN